MLKEIIAWITGAKVRAANKAYSDAVENRRDEFTSLSYSDFRSAVQNDPDLEVKRNYALRVKLGTYAIFAVILLALLYLI